ncbi:thiamine pyrophosphate-binding protein [Nocardioides sp. Root1257]|uniref:thiamine pyrophosphate-dependent enzyme n=1 Tax=unclassified Nocardioides TaxID=2615069 RepID=UPI0006FDD10E|nr:MULTISPECIES: thiamine pyrophosphate-dependent enzyme [unclassified Nocardioides]KQW43942.1 thiamine pyrophosphate-binding protein [Nocardioides sp. Root1257]KRC42383.1 thiamine pyrophosphate-binding protein [Nocardioides sp. Root224]
MTTVAELLVDALAEHGVTQVWGVVGDALNPVTDAIHHSDQVTWMGVRHEEAGAFAAGAQAQLTGRLGVCMGTVGPGSIHLLNGLYDAKKSHAPVLAICGQVPRPEIGSDFFQEVDNDVLFADVAVFTATVSSPEQLPALVERAGNAALQQRGVAVLTLPGDVGGLDVPKGTPVPRFVTDQPPVPPLAAAVSEAAAAINGVGKVTMLVGAGARPARAEVLAVAERLSAPMVVTLKGKEGLEVDNPFEVGQSGLLGNHASAVAFDGCDVLLMVGTDFPYKEFYPSGKVVVQIDAVGENIGRRHPVDHAVVGDARVTLQALLPLLEAKTDTGLLDKARSSYDAWRERQHHLADPDYERKPVGLLRRKVENPGDRIRPELLASVLDRQASDDAVFTTDTGMATTWLARFVRMRGRRQLLGSFNLGSMANAMPQALGAQALDRDRQVIAFCGDGGLSMLLGDLITAVTHDLPVKLVVFDNGSLGMVKLEMEQAGLSPYGTRLDNPDFAEVARAIGMKGIRVEDPHDVEGAVLEALTHDGPVLLDVLTNPDEIAIPPKPTLEQGWGFAIAKSKEFLESSE